jgi:hypothetical protein
MVLGNIFIIIIFSIYHVFTTFSVYIPTQIIVKNNQNTISSLKMLNYNSESGKYGVTSAASIDSILSATMGFFDIPNSVDSYDTTIIPNEYDQLTNTHGFTFNVRGQQIFDLFDEKKI